MSSIPVFIPYVNRSDLLDAAIESANKYGSDVFVINNSGKPIRHENYARVLTPPVPLTFSQTQNWMIALAKDRYAPFYLFMHSDAEAIDDTVLRLVAMANAYAIQKRKWGAIFTAYDALAAYNVEAMTAIGGWDTMLSWYCSDNDCYRRLRLAGYPTLESSLPVKHTPSQTLNSDSEISRRVNLEIPFRESYYRAKWGGNPGQEIFTNPFNSSGS
jgi:hypothetical protein